MGPGPAADRPLAGPSSPEGRPARWLFLGGDGRLTAYGPSPEGLVRWTESADGHFGAPEAFDVEGWAGRLSLARSSEGYVYLAGLRRPDGGDPPRVVLSGQFQTGRPLHYWHDLGEPVAPGAAPGDPVIAGPVVVVNQTSGSVHVLVSLRTGGILRRSRAADGRWGRWKSVSTEAYTGEFAAAMPAGGPLEVLAVSHADGLVDRWAGAGGGRFAMRDRFATPVVDGTQIAVETGRKRATYFWRYPGDDSLVAWRAAAGDAPGSLMSLGGAGGVGRPGVGRTMIGGYDCTFLAQNGPHGTVDVTAYVTEGEGYGTWWNALPDTGGPVSAPQVAVDGMGRLVVAVVDHEGALLVARQNPAQDGLVFGRWSRY
ncbi:hypothetical protein ACGFMM_27045 [Streptomyces sp. NPDC048604]|uniref:hypothetical protein n=1 Tax=Streptomyces sp. NPDC048604 TaxID=3365578 RepID=UPI003717E872